MAAADAGCAASATSLSIVHCARVHRDRSSSARRRGAAAGRARRQSLACQHYRASDERTADRHELDVTVPHAPSQLGRTLAERARLMTEIGRLVHEDRLACVSIYDDWTQRGLVSFAQRWTSPSKRTHHALAAVQHGFNVLDQDRAGVGDLALGLTDRIGRVRMGEAILGQRELLSITVSSRRQTVPPRLALRTTRAPRAPSSARSWHRTTSCHARARRRSAPASAWRGTPSGARPGTRRACWASQWNSGTAQRTDARRCHPRRRARSGRSARIAHSGRASSRGHLATIRLLLHARAQAHRSGGWHSAGSWRGLRQSHRRIERPRRPPRHRTARQLPERRRRAAAEGARPGVPPSQCGQPVTGRSVGPFGRPVYGSAAEPTRI